MKNTRKPANETDGEYLIRITDDSPEPPQRFVNVGPMVDGWRDKIEHVRFEQRCRQQCDELKTDIWGDVLSLLVAAKRNTATRANIATAIDLQRGVDACKFTKSDVTKLRTIYERFRRHGKRNYS